MTEQKDQITTRTGDSKIPKRYVRQKTLQYKTFLKQSITESLQIAFENHPDSDLAKTKIDIEYPLDRASFPQIVIKYYEKSIDNIGVGHEEWGPSPEDENYGKPGPISKFIKYYHRLYKGDLEFEIVGLSSVDRDKLSDALIEVLAMTDVSPEGVAFYKKLYETIGEVPYVYYHNIALNTDLIMPYGENQELAPWMAEDILVYKTAYRIPVFGDFYSLTPSSGSQTLISEVDFYAWDEADETDVTRGEFEENEIPEADYIKVSKKKEPTGGEVAFITYPDQETKPHLETSPHAPE